MWRIFILFNCIFIISCNTNHTRKQDNSLKVWIENNQNLLMVDTDKIIQEYNKNDLNNNWGSISIATTLHMENSLGKLAKLAGDSTLCIIVEFTFYKDLNQKRKIMIAAEDSTCLNKLDFISLETDSTNDFIFGKRDKPLY